MGGRQRRCAAYKYAFVSFLRQTKDASAGNLAPANSFSIMSRQERPTPPLSRPSVPPPPAVYSARQQLHLRPAGWEGIANATPRELPPLDTNLGSARGDRFGADASVTNSLNEIHAQADATEHTHGIDDLKKELEALKKELLDQS